jgi:hypothetical protein
MKSFPNKRSFYIYMAIVWQTAGFRSGRQNKSVSHTCWQINPGCRYMLYPGFVYIPSANGFDMQLQGSDKRRTALFLFFVEPDKFARGQCMSFNSL